MIRQVIFMILLQKVCSNLDDSKQIRKYYLEGLHPDKNHGGEYASYLLTKLKQRTNMHSTKLKKYFTNFKTDAKDSIYGDDNIRSRRMFDWLKNWFGKAPVTDTINTTGSPTTLRPYEAAIEKHKFVAKNMVPYKKDNPCSECFPALKPLDDIKISIISELDNSIRKLTDSVNELNWNLINKQNNGDNRYASRRIKREIVNNIAKNNDATGKAETIEANNNTKTDATAITPQEAQLPTANRRAYSTFDKIKKNVLKYINDSYNDFLRKYEPVSEAKESYKEDILYKIGYLVANVDNLKDNLDKIKKQLDSDKYASENKIVQTLDALLVANRVISEVVDTLKSYLESTKPYNDINNKYGARTKDNFYIRI